MPLVPDLTLDARVRCVIELAIQTDAIGEPWTRYVRETLDRLALSTSPRAIQLVDEAANTATDAAAMQDEGDLARYRALRVQLAREVSELVALSA